jgi:hypothetical protein
VGRYTHRVAISNHRGLDIENGQIRLADTLESVRQHRPQETPDENSSADKVIVLTWSPWR